MKQIIVYLAGSIEGKFVVDRVFIESSEAIEYAEKRKNDEYEWAVMAAPTGESWRSWTEIHRTTKG